MSKRIHLFALKQSTVGHMAIGLWRHPASQVARYESIYAGTAGCEHLPDIPPR